MIDNFDKGNREMKAIVNFGNESGQFGCQDFPEPDPHHGEVKVNIKASGLCYSDVAIIHNRYAGRKPVPIPLVLDHEAAGVVSAMGEGVTELRLGDPMAIEIARNRSRVSLFGLYPEAKISPLKILRKGLTLFGDVSQLDRHFLRTIKWVETGKVLAAPIIKRRYKFEEFEEAFASSRNKYTVKVLFEN